MSFLNLMGNKLKPNEVNDALNALSSSGESGESGGGGGSIPNYSYDEIDTGVKWVDGRTIYMKTFSSSVWTSLVISGSPNKIINTPENLDVVIDALIVGNNGNDYLEFRPFIFVSNSGILAGGISSTLTSGDLVLWYVKKQAN